MTKARHRKRAITRVCNYSNCRATRIPPGNVTAARLRAVRAGHSGNLAWRAAKSVRLHSAEKFLAESKRAGSAGDKGKISMSMIYPTTDTVTRARNAQIVNNVSDFMPPSSVKAAIAQVLKAEGYIEN